MTLEVLHRVLCDGCGAEIDVPNTVLPVFMKDEDRQDLHFCDHRCLVPYAARRHAERVAKVSTHLRGNVEQIRANLAAAEADPERQHEAEAIRPHLQPAIDALAAWEARS